MFARSFITLALFLSPLLVFSQEAEVLRMKGEVRTLTSAIKTGDILKEGETIEVIGKKSFVQLKLTDGSLILQREGKLKLKILKKGQTLINFLRGKIFVFKNPEEDSKLNVLTRKVSMAVRGTKFYIHETPEDSYLCVCEGVVAARNRKGMVDIAAGEDLHAKSRSSLEKTSANDDMMSMASEGFSFMGIPVEKSNF